MSKVFRLHNSGGKNDSTDWFDCQPYDSTIINDIKDPDGADARKQITSIPSPFARIDLVKTAFAEVVNSGNLDGDTIYHRMVSETLDVAELFFNFDTPKIKDNFKIATWNRQRELETLRSSNKDIAETLEMFLNQDADAYNFGRWQNVYLLQYVGPSSKELQIVGMTSPCTMFCSTANDNSSIAENIHFGQDSPFDMHFQPLYKRDENFLKYLYTFRANCDLFPSLFKELNDYMSYTFDNKLGDDMRTFIRGLMGGGATAFDAYKELRFGAAQAVEILGYTFHTKGSTSVINSDFEIRSNIFNGQRPLVLPCDNGNIYANWRYTQDNWSINHKAPYYDPNPLNMRMLPSDNNRYPYLTISDLLEDTIIEIPDSKRERLPNGTSLGGFNRQWFFDGNRQDADNKPNQDDTVTLLPIKPLFFEYFTTDELINGFEGKQMISINTNASGYRVVLRIPTRKGFVEYERLYMTTRDIKCNKGCRVALDSSFAFAMLPPVKAASDNEAYYRIAFSTDYAHSKTTRMKLFFEGKELSAGSIVRNDRSEHVHVSHIIALDRQRFDFIQISDSTIDAQGIIIPRLRNRQTAGNTYRFAIDFGTTNTHIEYRIGEEKPQPFSLSDIDSPMQYLCNYSNKRYVLEADIMPSAIGNGEMFSYPTRTALAEPMNLNWQQPVKTMAHVNPAFTYEKRQTYAYTQITTNLKWDSSDSQRAREYIRALMMLIRSKVLVEGGTLENTRIAWFYPTAMSPFRLNNFAAEWDSAYRDFFGGNMNNVQSITESEAPYIAYRKAENVSDNVVTIDIGGGTTDVVIVSKGQLQAITSFRFAADSIFGSGFTDGQGSLNGIVKHFQEQISSVLENNGMNDLMDILHRLNEKGRSEDIASFLFSLRDNKAVQAKQIADKVDFNIQLRNDQEFKLSILLFYISIIYHVASIMRIKGMPAPRIVSFSGNGSKVLRAIGAERTINALTRNIVELLFGNIGSNGIDVKTTANPKEQTCRGGLQDEQPMTHEEAISKIVVLKNHSALYPKDETYENAICEEEKKQVVDSVNLFLDFVKQLNQRFSFADQFGVSKSALQHLDGVCRRDLDEYLSKGIHRKLKEMNDDTQEKVQESLFFYPLTGVLSALNSEIYNSLHGNVSSEPISYTFLTNVGGGTLKESPSSMSAQFRLVSAGDTEQGTFEFCGDVNGALANPDATFDGAATYSGSGTSISTIEKGEAKQIGNGYWQVTQLATIKIQ